VPAKPSEHGKRKESHAGPLGALQRQLERHAWSRVLESTVTGFLRDEVPDQAAAMTYYGIFSLFPLILVFLAIGGIVLQNNDYAREQVVNLIIGLLPQGQDAMGKMISDVIKAKGAAAGIGLLTLLWSALGWFQVIDKNVNRIWGVGESRSFLKSKLFALAMVAAIGGVALLSFLAQAAVKVLADVSQAIPGSASVWQAAVVGLSLLAMALAFYLLYRYAPRRKVYFADVWPAALITALIWEVTRSALAIYLQKNDMISGYGPIGAAMAMLFWLYVASVIILVGAELAYAIAKERRHIEPEEEMPVIDKPGEQPSPKFAPQVGHGASRGQDEQEPVQAQHPTGGVQPRQPVRAGRPNDPAAHEPTVGDPPRSRVQRPLAAGLGTIVRGLRRGVVAIDLWDTAREGKTVEVAEKLGSQQAFPGLAAYAAKAQNAERPE